MVTKTFSIDSIKSLYSARIFRRGMEYYKQGRVYDLEFEDEGWTARVIGSETYRVSVDLSMNSVAIDCTCPACEQYGECKHEVAVLLAILDYHEDEITQNDRSNDLKRLEKEKTEHFIDLFSTIQQNAVESVKTMTKSQLLVEFICSTNKPSRYGSQDLLLKVEMKVGLERAYVVKNIRDFLKKVKNQVPHEFTKNFTFDPQEHYFSLEDKDIINHLLEIMDNETIYKESHPYYWQSSYTGDRDIIIPPIISKVLLTKLIDRNCSFEFQQVVYRQMEMTNQPLPFSFQLNKSETGDFQLNLKNLFDIAYFEKYGWVFHNGFFYSPTVDQKSLIGELLSLRSAEIKTNLMINHDQISSFLSTVLPGLKKLGNVEITEKISDQIIQPSLQSKLYIDEQYGRIHVKLEYHYDGIVINPFEKDEPANNENGVILLRDSEREQVIMSIIEMSPLKYNGLQLYLDEDDDSIYDFLFHVLPELEGIAEIYMSNGVQSYFQSSNYTPVTSIDVKKSGNFLDVNFDINGIDKTEIDKVLTSVVEKKRYYRLSNGTFVSLESGEFENIQQLFGELNISTNQLHNHQIQVPIYRGLQVDDIMKNGNKYSVKLGKAFRNFVQHLKDPEDIDFEFPVNLKASLRDYQKTGFQWLKALAFYQLGGILADDMGLGKTLQSISYILSEKQSESGGKPFLIVSPASLVYNWKSEFEKFAPSLQTEIVIGTPKERSDILQTDRRPDVWITSYPTFRQDLEHYNEIEFDTVILDEAQAIKNHATKTSQAIRKVNAGRRFALSGTPIENSLDELWAIFQAILPGLFPSQQEFRKLSHEKIARMVSPFILRRVKKDVLKELPDKIESNHHSELTKNQKEIYLAYLEKIQQETAESIAGEGFNKNRIKILAGLTRLRQLCCHPSLFLENYTGESGKLEELIEITKNAVESGKRLLIFSQFSSMLKIIRDRMQEEGILCFYLDGQTPSKDRVEMSNRFNEGENNVFLISLKAGGTGLNLTGAETVVLYDLWWNPAVEEQAAGRAHRIGQKNVVQVIRLIARGTIEEKIYELQQKKKELIEQVIQPGETMLTSLSENEIRELLSI